MNRHQRRFERARLSNLARASRVGLAEKVEALRDAARAAPDRHQRVIAGRWVLVLTYHLRGDQFANAAAVAAAKEMGWTNEQIAVMTSSTRPFWMLTTSLEGRPRSSCDEDWKNLGDIHDILGVPIEQGREVILASDPNGIHHFAWVAEAATEETI